MNEMETEGKNTPLREIDGFRLYWKMLRQPGVVLEQIARQPLVIAPGIVMLLGYNIYYALRNQYTNRVVQELGRVGIHAPGIQWQSFLIPFFMVLISWLAWAFLVYQMGKSAGGTGRFDTLFCAVGFSWFPYLFAYIIAGIIASRFPVFPPIGSISELRTTDAAFNMTVMHTLIWCILQAVLLPFSLWNVKLCQLTLEKTMGLPGRPALVIAGLLKALVVCINILAGFLYMWNAELSS